MKNALLPCVIAFLICSVASAKEAAGHHTISFPAQHPLVTFEVPDSWQERDEGDTHFIVSPDGGDVLVEVSMMKSGMNDDAATGEEARTSVDQDFTKLNLTEVPAGKQKGLNIIGLQGTGEDKHGTANIVLIAARNPAARHPVLIAIITAADAGEKHGQGIVGIMDTLAAPGAAAAPSAGKGSPAGVQTFGFPTKKPLISFDLPKGWQPKEKGGSLFVLSPDGADVIVEATTMKAVADDDAGAMKEAMDTVADFKKLKLKTVVDHASLGGMTVTMLNGPGEDSNGPARINIVIIKHPASKRHLYLSSIASEDKAQKHENAITALFDSITNAVAEAPGNASPDTRKEVQTVFFPGKNKPPFRVGIPAGWKIQEKDDGLMAISPDESVSMDFTATEMKYAGTALKTMKRLAAEQYGEFVWNKGKPATVVQLDDSMTLTIENGKCSIKGQTLVSSFMQYVKSDRDLFLIVGIRYLTDAPDKFTNEIDGVVKSVSFQ